MKNFSTYPALIKLLDENQNFALSGRGTTNHCPMALSALAAMGASEKRLQDFFEHWRDHYSYPMPASAQCIDYQNFQDHLGRPADFGDLQTCFRQKIEQAGSDQVVREVLALIPLAPATNAFHAWIRLAYGLQFSHAGEIAAGLAALVVANFKINLKTHDRSPATSVAEGFQQLSMAMSGKKFAGQMITEKMRAVIADTQFVQALPAVPENADILSELAVWAIAAYWQTGDFTVLHMVTGTNAARLILPYLNSQQAAIVVQDFWIALCVAYASVGAPPVSLAYKYLKNLNDAGFQPKPWNELFDLAIRSNDDHVIKFTYTCSQEHALSANLLYPAAAMQKLKLPVKTSDESFKEKFHEKSV
ncbi:questin oxidase family protein [Undibacterium sp. TJN19]|uniref:questin oxidase family protein n=1 Tax=Undibacterium sp. TJN19 TaxID=3413055 RepID=UPI003BF0BA87